MTEADIFNELSSVQRKVYEAVKALNMLGWNANITVLMAQSGLHKSVCHGAISRLVDKGFVVRNYIKRGSEPQSYTHRPVAELLARVEAVEAPRREWREDIGQFVTVYPPRHAVGSLTWGVFNSIQMVWAG